MKYNFRFICLILLSLAAFISAQTKPDNKTVLANFDKSIETGKLSEIERDLFSYVIANPNDAVGFSLLAKLRLKQSRLIESKSLANKALSLDSTLISAKFTLAVANFQIGEIEQTRAILDGISQTNDDSILLKIAELYASIGDYNKALNLTEKLSPKIKNSDALPIRAKCFLATNDTKDFALALTTVKTLAKQNQIVTVKFAEVLSNAKLHKETVDLLGLVAVSASKNVEVFLLLAKSEIYLKDFANSKKHLTQAEKIEPNSARLFFVKSLLESEQGNDKAAFEWLEKSLADNPNNIEFLNQFVITAMRANYSGKAFRTAEKLIEMQPENVDFLYLYGASALQNKNLPTAEATLTKFLEMRPNDSRGCVALGLTLAAQPEKLEIARGQMQKCLTINPQNSEAAYQLGLSYKSNGETAKAIEYLEVAGKLSPNNPNVLRDLGTVYVQTGAETKARPVLEKAVSLNPNDAETHFQLSRLYNVIGERELAKKHLEIFQKLKNPKKEGM